MYSVRYLTTGAFANIFFTVIIVVSVFVCGCTINGTNSSTPKTEAQTTLQTISIAANLPMTGNLAVYGEHIREGATMALEDLKKLDPNGPNVTIDWQDNAGEPKKTVSIMQKQLLNSPDIYMSGVHPQSMAIKNQISAIGVPHFLWVFDQYLNREAHKRKISQNNFRTEVNFKIEPPLFFDYVKIHKPKRIAIIYVFMSHTQEEYEGEVVPGLKKLGVKDILVEPYDIGVKDFKNIAVKVRDFKPDLIILSGFQDGLVGLIRAFRPLGLISGSNTIASYDLLDAAKILSKDEIEGIRFSAPLFVTRSDKQEIKNWMRRFYARTKNLPLYTDAFAYDEIMIIHDAAKRVHLPASSTQWLEALRATKLQGITGPLLFDEDGSLSTPVEIGVYRNGKVIPDSFKKLHNHKIVSKT